MKRMMVTVALAVFAGGLVEAKAQDFAVFSPQAVARIQSQKDTPAGRAIVRAADAGLGRKPHVMPVVHTEGTLPHAGIRDESVEAQRDWPLMQSFAFAYRLTGDKKYLAELGRFLDAWFPVYKSSGNPIDETALDNVAEALDLTRGNLPAQTESRTVEFFRGMSARYLEWLDHNYAKDPYNWSSHRVKLAVVAAYECGDKELIRRSGVAFTRQLKQNMRADGSVNDFYKRDALHYVVYDLEPLTVAAAAARAHGHDWFHGEASGVSVEKGLDWLAPFALGEKTHQEFVHSTVGFDAARDKAGEKGYSGQWDPASSVGLMWLAAWMDAKYLPVAEKVAAKAGKTPPPWIRVAMGSMASAQK